MKPLFVIGFMGAGKSTVGGMAAALLERPFCDLDKEIEAAEGRNVDELFDALGEEGFRAAEREVLERVSGHEDAVVACGGGVVTDAGSRALLSETGDVVYLAVSPEEAMARVGGETAGRPLLRGVRLDDAVALLSSRERLYDAVADLTIFTVGHSPEELAGRIATWERGRS